MRVALIALLAVAVIPLRAQSDSSSKPTPKRPIAHSKAGKSKAASPKSPALVPLTPRERAIQVLNRFTFGPRPGDVERMLSAGIDKWFDQQLDPDTINDDALNKRLARLSHPHDDPYRGAHSLFLVVEPFRPSQTREFSLRPIQH